MTHWMKNVIRITGITALGVSSLFGQQKKETPKSPPNAAAVKAPAAPTPVGVVVKMSDGTEQVFPLGVWLTFQNNTLRVIFPLQYVDQLCIRQGDGSWKYPKPGRNVQVWRNGSLQRRGVDYTLDTIGGRVMPIKISVAGLLVDWSETDVVMVAYLY